MMMRAARCRAVRREERLHARGRRRSCRIRASRNEPAAFPLARQSPARPRSLPAPGGAHEGSPHRAAPGSSARRSREGRWPRSPPSASGLRPRSPPARRRSRGGSGAGCSSSPVCPSSPASTSPPRTGPEGRRPRGPQPARPPLPRAAREGNEVRQPGEGLGRGAGDPGIPDGDARRRKRDCSGRWNSRRGSRTSSGGRGSRRASPRTPRAGWRSSPRSAASCRAGLSTKPFADRGTAQRDQVDEDRGGGAAQGRARTAAKEWQSALTFLAAAGSRRPSSRSGSTARPAAARGCAATSTGTSTSGPRMMTR